MISLGGHELLMATVEESMSDGSDESGEDLVSGRHNRSNSTTTIFLRTKPDENGSLGAVFVAGVTYLYDEPKPDGPLTGVRGLGWNRTWWRPPSGGPPVPGGIGVEGVGAHIEGTGVLGLGGGSLYHLDFGNNEIVGSGGIGVHGIGGATLSSNLMQRGQGLA